MEHNLRVKVNKLSFNRKTGMCEVSGLEFSGNASELVEAITQLSMGGLGDVMPPELLSILQSVPKSGSQEPVEAAGEQKGS